MAFGNAAGLLAFLALVPFIVIYLKRPRPKQRAIPSVMFFMKDSGATKFSNLFRQFFRNLLFLLQLLFLSLAAFAAAAPFITSSDAAVSTQTVLVIDGSASMAAKLSMGSGTRFERAVELAMSKAEGTAGIVLAANLPVVVLERGSSSEARNLLASLKPLDTETHVGDAMLSAGELISGDKSGRVVVLSDFQFVKGSDVLVAKRSLAARGIDVELVNVLEGEDFSSLSNVGFIGMDINKFETTALVRNYDSSSRAVSINVLNNGRIAGEEGLSIGPRSTESLSFETLPGDAELRIVEEDDFIRDNALFVSSPARTVRTLLITNSDTSNLIAALRASPSVELAVSFPPVVPDFDYDVIILHNASSQFMLPGFYKEIARVVANGTGLVITAQDSLNTYLDRFGVPLKISGLANSSRAAVKIENFLTQGVDFGVVSNYFSGVSSGKLSELVVADDGSPLLAIYSAEAGNVVYYGFLDDFSTFKSSYHYPIFWDNLVSVLTRTEDLKSFNLVTGRVEGIREQRVRTPDGHVKTTRLFFDKAGFYSYDDRTVAANLLSPDESDIASDGGAGVLSSDSGLVTEAREAGVDLFFDRKLIVLALVILLAELFVVKRRGDF